MNEFLQNWGEAAYTSFGFFWMALWAFIMGYAISAMIQILVTERRMQRSMGNSQGKSMFLGTFFGFISSSCSFAALASTKSLFKKGASFASSMAFLLASTNLVIELGVIISVFLGWQFVVGEYVGGLLLIFFSWLLIKIIKPNKLIKAARKHLGANESEQLGESESMAQRAKSSENWAKIGKQYAMEWKMVWKDITLGFTIAGIVAVFVPDAFFQTLFIGSGEGRTSFDFVTLFQHVIVGPIAAFLTFIGSMGNIPLAALLYGKGVSFAGVMAFIFSDLVVFPILRINAKYYGWKMSLFILFLLFSSLIGASLLLHYGFNLFDLLPKAPSTRITDSEHFTLNYTFFLNVLFMILSGILIYLGFFKGKEVPHHKEMAPKSKWLEKILKWLSLCCYLWLGIGMLFYFIT